MASQFDDSDFIDRDFQNAQTGHSAAPTRGSGSVTFRPATREELDTRVSEAQQKLSELRRVQEQLERERAALEEARRRRAEFQTGRTEMLEHLNRGVTLMEQAEFTARRDAEQMGKTLANLRDALAGVQGIQEESWTQETWNVELTKALATIENARMEWNQARLKWPLFNGETGAEPATDATPRKMAAWEGVPFLDLCRVGLAITWPIATVLLLGLVACLAFRGR
jgi:hypothetical protein